MNIVELMANYKEGCSFKKEGNDYSPVQMKSGYFVAITDNEVNGDMEVEIEKISSIARFLNLKNFFYGFWEDEKTGKKYLDLSLHISDKNIAVETAKLHDQKAIYSCFEKDVVYVK